MRKIERGIAKQRQCPHVCELAQLVAVLSPLSTQRFVPCIFFARRLQPFLSSSTRAELRLPTLSEVLGLRRRSSVLK